ncbi:MAG: hypothetical protein JRI25_03225 [Deltaproteobacteria bacterium]|nr:hypothetical protein [Deltaproteobacteria bacterium]MBW2253596.1 hypothetical protein [Deltaproteobacteria bacterium]
MSLRTLSWLLLALVACGKQAPPPTAAPSPTPGPPLAAEEGPMLAEAPPPPRPTSNVDLGATITLADGTTTQGRVVRVERGRDWYAEEGWVDVPEKLSLTLEGNGTIIDAPWSDISSVDIRYGGTDEIDCQYDSGYAPYMYMCVLRTRSTATTTDGRTWEVSSRHRWRFTFRDGTETEFHANKLPVREQDVPRPGMATENHEMYRRLQKQVLDEASRAVTHLELRP